VTIKRAVTAGIMVILLGVLWVAGSATAHPPTDSAPGSGDVRVTGVTAPLLQYQGRLTDPDTGEPVTDGSHTMTFRLYDVASGGDPLWTELKDVPVEAGVFSTVLGDTTALDQGLFDGRELWLGVKIGADAEATPRQRILPVAYALSLVPGAVISTTSDSASLELINARTGATLVVTNTVQDGIWASGGSGNWAAGVVGYTYSGSHGMGVQGWSKADSGESYGVWGWTASPEGAGVKGIGQGGSHGVYGETAYDAEWYEANGVMGYSVYTNTAGVYGESEHGNGVFGKANADERSGVVGWNLGAASGVYGVSEQGHGVSGETHNVAGGYEWAGVYGRSTYSETFGVLGESDYGIPVEGRTREVNNTLPAVSGWNDGGGPGVRGYSQNSVGVEGYSSSANGIYGETFAGGFYEFAGVMGYSTYSRTFGVWGGSRDGIGVEGHIDDPENVNPAVVGFNTGAGIGVEGYSENNAAVYGNGATYGGHFVSSGGKALRADGDVDLNGNLDVSGEVRGGDGTTLPIAYAFIDAGGEPTSGSRNVSSFWNNKEHWYEISISEHSYFYSDYVTLVTVSATCSPAPCAAQTASVDGKLLISIYNGSGSPVQASFQFVTYKP
jgi:hypothetical protein